MKQIGAILLLLLAAQATVVAQNLVPNKNFSDGSCPSNWAQIDKVDEWYSPTLASPDYFNFCGKNNATVPSNFAGKQLPYEGSGYAGLAGLYISISRGDRVDTTYNHFRDYIQCNLSSPLEKGAKYQTSLRVSLADYNYFTVNKIGMLFSPTSITDYSSYSYLPIYKEPQVEFSTIISDTVNWVLLEDSMVADKQMEYLTIGVFADSSTLDIRKTGFGSPNNSRTYFYIDDVRVIKIRDALKIKKDTAFCSSYVDSIDLKATSKFKDYTWYDFTTNVLLQTGDSLLKVKPSTTTTYMVIAEGDTAYATIVINPLPIFNLGLDSNLCIDETIDLQSGLSNPSIAEYQWSTSQTASSITVDQTETEVWHQVTDTNGCVWRDTINLAWQTPPEVKLSNDTLICEGSTVEINSLVYILTPLNVTKEYNLTWQSDPTLTVTSDSTAQAHPLTDTWYFAEVDDDKCTGNIDSIWVEVKQNPITGISPKTQTICKGQQIEIIAAGGQTYLWDIGGSPETESTDNKRTLSSATSTYVAVQAIDAPCRGLWDTAFITIDNLPITADFTVTPDSGSTVFEPIVQNLSKGGDIYHWNFGNGDVRTVTSAGDAGVFGNYYPEYLLAGQYDISLRASRPSGCADSISKRIIVSKKFILEIPNAFSPNGDNLNDVWNITTSAGTTVSAFIYNRWGELIHQWSNSPQGESSGWDGTYRGKRAPQGVYFYMLTVKELDKTIHNEQGTISLIR